MPSPLWANYFLENRSDALRTYLNTGKTLKLFRNHFLPTPATPLSSFQESTFAGYAAVSLTNAFGAPTLVQAGQYQLTTGLINFTCTGGAQLIEGWYLTDGTHLLACELFTNAFAISAGITFQLKLRPQEISESLLVL